MKLSITANFFSKPDALYVLAAKGINASIILQMKKVKGAYLLCYLVNGRKCSTFVSSSDLLQAKLNSRIQKSKTVEFEFIDSVPGEDEAIAQTSNGHDLQIDFSEHTIKCSCHDFKKSALVINGHILCKHSIALTKAALDCTDIHSLISWFDVSWVVSKVA